MTKIQNPSTCTTQALKKTMPLAIDHQVAKGFTSVQEITETASNAPTDLKTMSCALAKIYVTQTLAPRLNDNGDFLGEFGSSLSGLEAIGLLATPAGEAGVVVGLGGVGMHATSWILRHTIKSYCDPILESMVKNATDSTGKVDPKNIEEQSQQYKSGLSLPEQILFGSLTTAAMTPLVTKQGGEIRQNTENMKALKQEIANNTQQVSNTDEAFKCLAQQLVHIQGEINQQADTLQKGFANLAKQSQATQDQLKELSAVVEKSEQTMSSLSNRLNAQKTDLDALNKKVTDIASVICQEHMQKVLSFDGILKTREITRLQKKYTDIAHHNGVDSKEARAAEQELDAAKEKGKEYDKIAQGISQSLTSLGGICSTLGNPKLGHKLSVVGQGAWTIYNDYSNFSKAVEGINSIKGLTAGGIAMATGNALGMVSAALSIGSALFGSSGEDATTQELQAIAKQVQALRKEMNERFDRVDRSLNVIYRTLVQGLMSIGERVRNLQSSLEAMFKSVDSHLRQQDAMAFAYFRTLDQLPFNLQSNKLKAQLLLFGDIQMTEEEFKTQMVKLLSWTIFNSKNPQLTRSGIELTTLDAIHEELVPVLTSGNPLSAIYYQKVGLFAGLATKYGGFGTTTMNLADPALWAAGVGEYLYVRGIGHDKGYDKGAIAHENVAKNPQQPSSLEQMYQVGQDMVTFFNEIRSSSIISHFIGQYESTLMKVELESLRLYAQAEHQHPPPSEGTESETDKAKREKSMRSKYKEELLTSAGTLGLPISKLLRDLDALAAIIQGFVFLGFGNLFDTNVIGTLAKGNNPSQTKSDQIRKSLEAYPVEPRIIGKEMIQAYLQISDANAKKIWNKLIEWEVLDKDGTLLTDGITKFNAKMDTLPDLPKSADDDKTAKDPAVQLISDYESGILEILNHFNTANPDIIWQGIEGQYAQQYLELEALTSGRITDATLNQTIPDFPPNPDEPTTKNNPRWKAAEVIASMEAQGAIAPEYTTVQQFQALQKAAETEDDGWKQFGKETLGNPQALDAMNEVVMDLVTERVQAQSEENERQHFPESAIQERIAYHYPNDQAKQDLALEKFRRHPNVLKVYQVKAETFFEGFDLTLPPETNPANPSAAIPFQTMVMQFLMQPVISTTPVIYGPIDSKKDQVSRFAASTYQEKALVTHLHLSKYRLTATLMTPEYRPIIAAAFRAAFTNPTESDWVDVQSDQTVQTSETAPALNTDNIKAMRKALTFNKFLRVTPTEINPKNKDDIVFTGLEYTREQYGAALEPALKTALQQSDNDFLDIIERILPSGKTRDQEGYSGDMRDRFQTWKTDFLTNRTWNFDDPFTEGTLSNTHFRLISAVSGMWIDLFVMNPFHHCFELIRPSGAIRPLVRQSKTPPVKRLALCTGFPGMTPLKDVDAGEMPYIRLERLLKPSKT